MDGVHGGAQAALIGFVLAVRGDLGVEHHRRPTFDGDLPAAARRPVRGLFVTEAGDVSIRWNRPEIVSGKTSAAQPGSMPVAWKDVCPSAQADSSLSTTLSPRLRG